MVFITLVRHGQTEMNLASIVQSRTPGDLTPRGVQMAENLGQYLKDEKFTRIYSSDLKRCHDTTLNILKHSNHHSADDDEIVLDKILRERDYGDLEFLSATTVADLVAKEIAAGNTGIGHHNVSIPGGEEYNETMKRCSHFFEKLCEIADTTENKENILVVSHGCWILALLDYLADNQDTFILENYDHVSPRTVLNTARTRFFIGRADDQNKRTRSIKFYDVVCAKHLKNM